MEHVILGIILLICVVLLVVGLSLMVMMNREIHAADAHIIASLQIIVELLQSK